MNQDETKPESKSKTMTVKYIECGYCHTPFEPKYTGQVCCDTACAACYKAEQHRRACDHDSLHHAEQ